MSGEDITGGAPAEGGAPAFDINTVIGGLSDTNRTTLERKGMLKDGKAVEGFSFDKVVDSYRHLEGLTGKKTLEEPNPADPEAFAKWEGHKILGVPDTVDGYKFDKPALPDGMKWSEREGDGGIQWDGAAEKVLRSAFLKAKVGGPQAQAAFAELVQDRVGQIVASHAARETEKVTITANLQKDYGATLKGQLQAGDMAIKHIATLAKIDPGAAIDGLASSMGNEAAMRFSIQLAKMLGEDTLAGGQSDGFATSPAAAKAKIEAFQADAEKSAALMDSANPRHKLVKAEWQNLNKLARPDS